MNLHGLACASTDLTNWLRYDKLTEVPSGLVDLVIHTDVAEDRSKLEEYPAISVASLLPDRMDETRRFQTEYHLHIHRPAERVDDELCGESVA